MHGRGKFVWKDGKTYEGAYEAGKKQGRGVMVWPNGIRYEGEWHQGKQHGEGELFDKDGSLLSKGRWEHGLFAQQ
jgi:hypothetical protein